MTGFWVSLTRRQTTIYIFFRLSPIIFHINIVDDPLLHNQFDVGRLIGLGFFK